MQFDSSTDVSAVDGENIILPTQLIFSSPGHCGVHPRFTEMAVAYNNVHIMHCNVSSGCVPTEEKPYNSYDFDGLDNITLPSSIGEGEYFFALQQCCPSRILDKTYTVTVFDSSGKLVHIVCLYPIPSKHTCTC